MTTNGGRGRQQDKHTPVPPHVEPSATRNGSLAALASYTALVIVVGIVVTLMGFRI